MPKDLRKRKALSENNALGIESPSLDCDFHAKPANCKGNGYDKKI